MVILVSIIRGIGDQDETNPEVYRVTFGKLFNFYTAISDKVIMNSESMIYMYFTEVISAYSYLLSICGLRSTWNQHGVPLHAALR